MILKVQAVLICLFFAATANSQHSRPKFTISKGSEMKMGPYHQEILGEFNGEILLKRSNKFEVFLEKLNKSGEITKSVSLDQLTYRDNPKNLHDIHLLNDKLLLFFYSYEKSTDKFWRIIEEYDMESLSSIREVQVRQLNQGPAIDIFNYGKDEKNAYLNRLHNQILVSQNQNYFAETRFLFAEGKKKNDAIHITVFNKEFKEIWTQTYELPYPAADFKFQEMFLDNSGQLHLTGLEFSKEKYNSKTGKPKDFYHILSLLNNGTSTADFKIDVAGEFVNNLVLMFTSDGSILATGLYYHTNKQVHDGSTDGIYVQRYDPSSKSELISSKLEFSSEMLLNSARPKLNQEVQKNYKKDQDVKLPVHQKFYNFQLDADNFLVRADKFPATSQDASTLALSDISSTLLYQINAKGEIVWAKLPALQQEEEGSQVINYNAGFVCANKYHFIYSNLKVLLNSKYKTETWLCVVEEDSSITGQLIDSTENEFNQPEYIELGTFNKCGVVVPYRNGNKTQYLIVSVLNNE